MISLALLDPWALDSTAARLLLELALKGAILLAAAAIVTRLWRGAPAAVKHLVWVVTMGSLLLLPLLVAEMPRWRIPLSLPQLQVAAIAAQSPAAPSRETSAAIPHITPAPLDFAASTIAPSLSWEEGLMIVWAAGAALFFALLLIAHLRIIWLTSRAWPVCSERCDELVDRLCQRLGIRRAPMLIETGADAMPMTWGLLRPVIALPRGAADAWPEQRLEAVLLHELAHLRRRDIPVQLMAQIVCALHWFNPLAWHALQRIRLESEKACDDVVLAQGVKPSVYAEYLLGLARAQGGRRAPALAGMPMAEASQLPVRLRALLDEAQRRGRASLALLGGLLMAGAMAACVVASASPATAGGGRAHTEERAARASGSNAERPSPVPVAERAKYRPADGAASLVPVAVASPRRVDGRGLPSPIRYQTLPLSPGDTLRPVLMNAGEVRAAVERNYPSALRQAGLSGTALLELRLDTRGRVSEIRVMNASDPAFGEAASQSLADARFAPARTEDGPIAMRVLWPVAFNAIDSGMDVARMEPAIRYEVAEARAVAVERAVAATTARPRRVVAEMEAVERAVAATTARPRRVAAEMEAVERATAASSARPRRVSPEVEAVERAVAETTARPQRVTAKAEAVERSVAATSARSGRVAAEMEAVARGRAAAASPEPAIVVRGRAAAALPGQVVIAESLEGRRSCPNMILDAWRDTAAVERALRSARPRNPVIVIDGRIATDSELQSLGIQAGVPLDGSEKIRELTVLHDTRQLLGTNIPGGVVCIYPGDSDR